MFPPPPIEGSSRHSSFARTAQWEQKRRGRGYSYTKKTRPLCGYRTRGCDVVSRGRLLRSCLGTRSERCGALLARALRAAIQKLFLDSDSDDPQCEITTSSTKIPAHGTWGTSARRTSLRSSMSAAPQPHRRRGTFVRRLNASMQHGTYDAGIFETLAGQPIDALWAVYGAALAASPDSGPCRGAGSLAMGVMDPMPRDAQLHPVPVRRACGRFKFSRQHRVAVSIALAHGPTPANALRMRIARAGSFPRRRRRKRRRYQRRARTRCS